MDFTFAKWFLVWLRLFTSRGTVYSDYLDMRRHNCKLTSSRWIQRLPLTNWLNLGVLDNPRIIQNDGNHPTAENNKLYTMVVYINSTKQYLEFIKFLLAKFIKCTLWAKSFPACTNYFPFIHVCQVSPHSHLIDICIVTQWSLFTRFLLLPECILCERKFL